MNLFDGLTLVGGLCLFLFGMLLMGNGLEKAAGNKLKTLLGKMTTKKSAGLMTGIGVTGIIQSSSATTVMVLGFVNSGLMTLKQAINVIMGANIGTTVTPWILSLTGIDSSNVFVQLLKPASFTPVLAAVGIVLLMTAKTSRKKDVGTILLGFTTLMFGMETMSAAVAGLKDVPEFQNLLLMFSNPLLGVLAGAILTGIIQSSSASVGILQALSSTGQVTFGAAIPIIMGQNIGTTITALISSVGTNKNARRAAVVHLIFNILGTLILLPLFILANALVRFAFVDGPINQVQIAVVHTAFNILCTLLLLPASSLLEKLSFKIIPDTKTAGDTINELDERLLATPTIALERCYSVAKTMANFSYQSIKDALSLLQNFDSETAARVRENEQATDHYEDILGNYLVRLSRQSLSDQDSTESAKLLRVIGDLERISDHAVNLLESAEEIRDKEIVFLPETQQDLSRLINAVEEILELSITSFVENDYQSAALVHPLEEVIDQLKEQLRSNHISRIQKGESSFEVGFVWADLLTNLERVADHCSNIANCTVENFKYSHEQAFLNGEFAKRYQAYAQKYALK